jgi:hypothetical protein
LYSEKVLYSKNRILTPIEIKSGTTYQEKWWKYIMDWQVFYKKNSLGVIVFIGNENHNFSMVEKLCPTDQFKFKKSTNSEFNSEKIIYL